MANIYTPFANGTFESGTASLSWRKGDASSPAIGTATDSTDDSFSGSKSLKVLDSSVLFGGSPLANRYAMVIPFLRVDAGFGPNVVPLVVGKIYRAKCKVKTPSANPIANPEAMILFGGFSISGLQVSQVAISTVSSNRKRFLYNGVDNPASISFKEMTGAYVADITDTWLEVEYIWRHLSNGNMTGFLTVTAELFKINENGSNPAAILDLTVGGTINNQTLAGGKLFVDDITIDEVIACDLAYGSPSYTKTDETGVGLGDGTITVNATSSFLKQYRLDGGAWMNSNFFSGVSVGTHTIEVQDMNGCTLAPIAGIQILAFVPPSCDMSINTLITTNETGVGLNDGSATINATSTGPGPKLFSLDNVTFQTSNSFTPLAPGNYIAYVKNNDGSCLVSQAFTIQPFAAPPIAGTLTMNKKPVNNYNFISWFSVVGKINFASIVCANIFWDLPKIFRLNKIPKKHYPVVTNDEQFSFYINFTQNYNNPNFASLRLDLISNYGVVQQNVGTLQRVFQDDGTNYYIYASVTLSGITPGIYRLAITDTSTVAPFDVRFITQEIQVMFIDDAPALTARFRFRASVDIYKYLYTKIPTFFQEIRLIINVDDEDTDGDIDQYRAVSSGKLRNYAFDLDLFYTIETYYWDDLAHRAAFVFQVHDIILLNDKTYIIKSMYKVKWQSHMNVNKGTLVLFEQDFSTINRFGDPDAIVITDPVLGSDDGDVIGT